MTAMRLAASFALLGTPTPHASVRHANTLLSVDIPYVIYNAIMHVYGYKLDTTIPIFCDPAAQ